MSNLSGFDGSGFFVATMTLKLIRVTLIFKAQPSLFFASGLVFPRQLFHGRVEFSLVLRKSQQASAFFYILPYPAVAFRAIQCFHVCTIDQPSFPFLPA